MKDFLFVVCFYVVIILSLIGLQSLMPTLTCLDCTKPEGWKAFRCYICEEE